MPFSQVSSGVGPRMCAVEDNSSVSDIIVDDKKFNIGNVACCLFPHICNQLASFERMEWKRWQEFLSCL